MNKQLTLPIFIALVAIMIVGVIVYGIRVLNPPEPTRDGKPLGSSPMPQPGSKRGRMPAPLE